MLRTPKEGTGRESPKQSHPKAPNTQEQNARTKPQNPVFKKTEEEKKQKDRLSSGSGILVAFYDTPFSWRQPYSSTAGNCTAQFVFVTI